MARLEIRNGRVLRRGTWDIAPVSIDIDAAGHSSIRDDPDLKPDRILDADGLLVLPGIIDIHGDAFERQIEPRPHVRFALDTALLETDRQLLGNGITTAFHGVTWSWEPGLRGSELACALVATIERMRPRLAVDTRVHLRHETFNLMAEEQIIRWIEDGKLGCLAFNDHMSATLKDRHRPEKALKMMDRSGLAPDQFAELVDRIYCRREDVPHSIQRLAKAALGAGLPALSHDDLSPAQRSWFREIGVGVSEFPTTEQVAEDAIATGETTVFGAPNVVRGGSHTGCPGAADMVARGLCSILASDYYYPALLQAPFVLANNGTTTLEKAWNLVSVNPARALKLDDRGSIGAGLRADLVLVEQSADGMPSTIATIINGRIRYLSQSDRLV